MSLAILSLQSSDIGSKISCNFITDGATSVKLIMN